MPTFALTLGPGPGWDVARGIRGQDGWAEHAAFMDALVDDGFIVIGGPLDDGSRTLHLVDAASPEAVRDRMATDPWAASGHLVVITVQPWQLWLDGRGARERDGSVVTASDVVRALAEPDRLQVFAALLLGDSSVSEVGARSGLAAKDVARAVTMLGAAGVVVPDGSGGFRAEPGVLKEAVRTEQRVGGSTSDGAGAYFRRGRLLRIPGDAAVRSRVLTLVVEAFAPGVDYTEVEANALCAQWNDDWTSLRRALIDEGLLLRDAAGTAYRRADIV